MLGDCLYLDNVREFVEDENRIVSYKWLSRKLEVPADAAKKMLYAYAEHSSGKEGVTVTYAITGVKDTSQGKLLEVSLVKEEELEAAKNALQSVRGVHIYSVQKTRIQDSSTLFSADYDICKEHISTYSRWSPISCSEPLPPSNSILHPHTKKNEKKAQFPLLDLKREQGRQKEGADAKAPKEKEPLKDTTKSSTSAAKALPRKLDYKKVSESRQKKNSRGGVTSYFTNTQTMKAKTEAKSSVKKIGGGCINDSDINDSSDSGGESVVPATPRPKASMKVTQGKKVADNSAKVHQAPLQRKRKRIQNTMSSDEEDSMLNKEEGNNKAKEAVGKRRKRVKRLKSRMYTTDDGAMVTEKVWESESTDESDSETRPENRGGRKAPVAAVKTVQNSPAKGTRQSLLSNFFKK